MNKFANLLIHFSCFLVFLSACQSPSVDPHIKSDEHYPLGKDKKVQPEYTELLQQVTVSDKEYENLYLLFEYSGTILTKEIQDAQLIRLYKAQGWSEEKFEKRRSEAARQRLEKSEMHLSFFTPDRDNNRFIGNKAIWKVYLTVGDNRYLGHIEKNNDPFADLVYLYPYHNRWSQAYKVTFPVPMVDVEGATPTVTITSSIGASTQSFILKEGLQ